MGGWVSDNRPFIHPSSHPLWFRQKPDIRGRSLTTHTKKAVLFVALAFLGSWALAGGFYVLGGKWGTTPSVLVVVAYMFMPMIAAIVVQKGIFNQPLKEPLGISFRPNRWFAVAWLLPPVLAFAALGVSLLLPGTAYSPEMEGLFERFRSALTPEEMAEMQRQAAELPVHPIWLTLAQGMVAGITLNAVAGFGEELGWRGLLQRELRHLGFWKSSALIGLVWGVWHAPLILQGHNYPQHPVAGVGLMIAWCVLLAPLVSYVRLRARSVIAAAVFHGTVNGTAGVALIVVKGGSDLTIGLMGLAGLIVLAAANLGLLLFERFGASKPIATEMR